MQKYAHLKRDVKNGAIHIPIKKNGSVIYSFLRKRGLIVYLAALKKGTIRAAHPYHVIYRELPPELLFYCTRKASNKTIKVTGNDGHELVWKAVATYLWMNVQPYLVDFYSD